MIRLPGIIRKTLSVRVSLTIVSAIGVLLAIALLIMLRYSWEAIREEAVKDAEQTLETTVEQIDNVLLSVEQTSGNFYWDLMRHLDQPDRMYDYCQRIIETNPNITGCAIAFEPHYYQEKGQLFMAYYHRSTTNGQTSLVQEDTFAGRPYNEQTWYTQPVQTGKAFWIGPLKDDQVSGEAIISFCLPIYSHDRKVIAVLGVDVALSTLSEIAHAAKPSPNAYCALLGSDGSYIIHPDSNKLKHQTVFTQTERGADPSVKEVAQAMVAGETGYGTFFLNNTENYVFYKPFKRRFVQGRTTENMGWSIGIVYPKNDIFGGFYRLLYYLLAIAGIGLLLLLIVCQWFTHRRLLPLRLLTKSAQRIADGHYDEPVPDTRQQDEIGLLQTHFQQMQQSLGNHINELEQLTANLQERGEVLQAAYSQAQKADRMKTAFLHNMTNQMIAPVLDIEKNVKELCEHYDRQEEQEADHHITDIQQQSAKITELLNHFLHISEQEKKNDPS